MRRCEGYAHRTARESDAPEPAVRRVVVASEGGPADMLALSGAVASLHRARPGAFVTAVEGAGAELLDFDPHVVAAEPAVDGAPVAWERVAARPPAEPTTAGSDLSRLVRWYCAGLERALGVPVPPVVDRPALYLSPEERARAPEVHELTAARPRYVLLCAGSDAEGRPAGGGWAVPDYQRLVDRWCGEVLFVQVGGSAHHPPLEGVLDLRGVTDLRRLARLALHAAGGVGPGGLLGSLCAALGRPYACVAGRADPDRVVSELGASGGAVPGPAGVG